MAPKMGFVTNSRGFLIALHPNLRPACLPARAPAPTNWNSIDRSIDLS